MMNTFSVADAGIKASTVVVASPMIELDLIQSVGWSSEERDTFLRSVFNIAQSSMVGSWA
jgi:hypothetical protein